MMIDLNRALESFIRAKYEQRKWIAKEWIPPEITVSSDVSVVLFMLAFVLIGTIIRIETRLIRKFGFCRLVD